MGRLTKRQKGSNRPPYWHPEEWTRLQKKVRYRETKAWEKEKPKLQHARNSRNLPNIAADDEEYLKRIAEARSAYELPSVPAMPLRCIDPSGSGKPQAAVAGKRTHQDHIASLGYQSVDALNLVYLSIEMKKVMNSEMSRR